MSRAVLALAEDLSQRADAVRDRARVHVDARPDAREQLFFGDELPARFGEAPQRFELLRRQRDRTPSRVSRWSRTSSRNRPNS